MFYFPGIGLPRLACKTAIKRACVYIAVKTYLVLITKLPPYHHISHGPISGTLWSHCLMPVLHCVLAIFSYCCYFCRLQLYFSSAIKQYDFRFDLLFGFSFQIIFLVLVLFQFTSFFVLVLVLVFANFFGFSFVLVLKCMGS